jgi:hypothetical protein
MSDEYTMNQEFHDITEVADIIDVIPDAGDEGDVSETEDGSDIVSTDDEFEYDSEADFIRVDDIGNSVERVVDVLGGIFVSSDGSTLADVLSRISDTLDKHVAAVEAQTAILEKQAKVLFKLAKVIESKN